MAYDRLKQVSTYVIVIFIVGILAALVTEVGVQIANSETSNLSENSKAYITDMTGGDKRLGWNSSFYQDDIGKASELGGNDNKNEFSLDFTFGRNSGNILERYAYLILNVPEFFLVDVFKVLEIKWVADIIDWVCRIFLFMAIVGYFRKGE